VQPLTADLFAQVVKPSATQASVDLLVASSRHDKPVAAEDSGSYLQRIQRLRTQRR